MTLALVVLGWLSLAPVPAQERELSWMEGSVELAGGVARVDLPAGWTYLGGADARFIVEEVWGNPPDPAVSGMIWPPDEEDGEPSVWAIVVSYSEDGHIDDGDAAEQDYDELLRDMQAGAEEENDARRAAGYGGVEIRGWAEAPHYDSTEKKLYWAKLLAFEGDEVDGEQYVTLNYDVRILGRHGALVLGAVAGEGDLEEVAAGCKEILRATEFADGYRYEDFDESIDSYAAYGIGGLVAGKVLAKAGFFKVILLFLAKGWKLVLVAGVALVAGWRKLTGGKRSAEDLA